jgi:hypothetical protein
MLTKIFEGLLPSGEESAKVAPGELVTLIFTDAGLLAVTDVQPSKVVRFTEEGPTFQDAPGYVRYFPQGGSFSRTENGALYFLPTPTV